MNKVIASFLLIAVAYTFIFPVINATSKKELIVEHLINLNDFNSGDIIFRRGVGISSEIARNFSEEEKRFSHVGIIVNIDSKKFVVHSIRDEDKSFNGVVTERIADFLQHIEEWAVYRINSDYKYRSKVAVIALDTSRNNIEFDREFNMDSDDKLYCTEFVSKSINKAVGEIIIKPKTKRIGKWFISISDVYLNPVMSPIFDSMNNQSI